MFYSFKNTPQDDGGCGDSGRLVDELLSQGGGGGGGGVGGDIGVVWQQLPRDCAVMLSS
jgi:hypothetical protein